MNTYLINVYNIIFVTLVLDVIIVKTKSENKEFKIRKCCIENELISERDSECVENKLLKVKSHFYVSEEIREKLSNDMDGKNSWPWWFPSSSKILSKQNNESLLKFPEKYQLIAGEELPCRREETSILPAFYYNFSFYDDGSLILYPDKKNENEWMKTKIFNPLTFCVDKVELIDDFSKEENLDPILNIPESEDYLVILCPCIQATCILKCCKPGMIFDMRDGIEKNSCIKSTGAYWEPIYSKDEADSDFFLLERMPYCKPGDNIVIPNYTKTKTPGYVIYSNGSARIEGEIFLSEPLEFCGDNVIENEDKKIHNRILRCYPKQGKEENEWMEIRRVLYGWLYFIGAVFLCLTLMIYYSVSCVRKLHDESLIYQTWCFFIAYICLAVSLLIDTRLPQGICLFFGFLIQYCFLAAFFWLNVYGFDVWYTFSFLKFPRASDGENVHKKKLYYFIYGWSTPGLIVIITILMEYWPGISTGVLKPEISELCWFKKGSMAALAYFYGPIAVLLGINFILFLHIAVKIMQMRNDISSAIPNRNIKNQRFQLYLKLFVLMGLSWIMELISWAVGGPAYYWYIPDTINILRAVFIFILFCFKKQVFKELKKTFGLRKDSNMTITRNTRNYTQRTVTSSKDYNEECKLPNNADSNL